MQGMWKVRVVPAALTLVAALGACGGDSGGPKSATTITQQQATVIGDAAASQIGSIAGSLTTFSAPSVGGVGGLFAPQTVSGRFLAAAIGRRSPQLRDGLALISRAGACQPAVTDSTDTDGDGIEDNATYTFTGGNCTYTDTASGTTISIVGSVHVQDTDDANTFYGYAIGFTGFGITVSDTSAATPDISTSLSGSFGTDVGVGGATGTENLHTTFKLGANTVFADNAVWTVSYTPSAGPVDTTVAQLPAGDLDINGQYSFSGDDGSGNSQAWAFGVQTTQSLAYDGTCTDDQWPFDAGIVNVYIAANQTVGFTVTYNGCGVAADVTSYTS
jgi:hypothetical protein